MEKKIHILLITLFTSFQITAQSSLNYKEATIEYADAQRPCVQLHLDPEPKTLKKAWEDYLHDNYGFKLDGIGFLTNKDLLTAEAVVISPISTNIMDFYTHIVEDENGSEMKVFIRFGYDIYVSSKTHPSEYRALNTILDNFLKSYLPKYYQRLIKETEKQVKKLEGETADLKDDIEDDADEIEKLKKEIKDLEKDLESNNELLEKANIKLKKRSEKLKTINNQLNQL